MVEWLFLVVPWGCLRFVFVVFPDYTHLLFFIGCLSSAWLTVAQLAIEVYFISDNL